MKKRKNIDKNDGIDKKYLREEYENFKKFIAGFNELKNVDGKPKQTCLEKKGFEMRDCLIQKNTYNGKTDGQAYSSMHENAVSTPDAPAPFNMKGKGSKTGGHLDYQGYYGKPKENPNEINYKNFVTISDKTRSIGNKVDVEMRNELTLKKRYNGYNNEYSVTNQDAISDGNIIGKGTGLPLDTTNGGGGYDVEARKYHLMRNEWRKDLEYSKPLVQAEYLIQSEFKIGPSPEDVRKQNELEQINRANREYEKQVAAQQKAERKAQKAAEKEAKAAAKANARAAKKEAKLGKVAQKSTTSPSETAYIEGDTSWMQYAAQYGYLPTDYTIHDWSNDVYEDYE